MVLLTASVFAETIITAEDYAVDSDVVLESLVKEVKSVPHDTAEMLGDVVKYARDEAEVAADAVAGVFKEESDARAITQREGELAVEDAWDSGNNVLFRSYKVSGRVGDLLMAFAPDKAAPSVDVAYFFKSVDFSEGTSAHYLPEFKCLFVHQNMAGLLAIEDVLSSYQYEQKKLTGHQVEIEAKFIEVSKSTLDELGFSWTFESKDGGDLKLFDKVYLPQGENILSGGLRGATAAFGGGPAAGLLNVAKNTGSHQWSMVISALERSDDSDVLSAPRVVTHSHETAVIQVGEERVIPKSFEVNNQNTSPYVQHSDWELELMGVHMEVTPEIRNDGLIDLELNAEILDIIGYDSYRITPEYSGASAIRTVTPVNASLPYLRVRSLETRATVADGNTIGMGGLIYDRIETFRDKVPVLGSIPLMGRLFRSEGDRSVKRNLMIFVTATQVDVNGRRLADLNLNK